MDITNGIKLAAHMPEISAAMGRVLAEIGGEDTTFLIYVISENFRCVSGNIPEDQCIDLLKQMIDECEKRKARRDEQAKPPLN